MALNAAIPSSSASSEAVASLSSPIWANWIPNWSPLGDDLVRLYLLSQRESTHWCQEVSFMFVVFVLSDARFIIGNLRAFFLVSIRQQLEAAAQLGHALIPRSSAWASYSWLAHPTPIATSSSPCLMDRAPAQYQTRSPHFPEIPIIVICLLFGERR